MCAVVSGGVAAFVGFRFQTQSFEIEGKLEYKGLPEMTKTNAWTPEAVETHSELLQSPTYLTTVIEKRNLGAELDVMGLQNALKVEADSRSKIITLILSWDDLPKGIEVLNDLMRMYIDRVVEDRRLTASEHVKHAEEELFRAEANEDNARKLHSNFKEKMGMTPFEQQQIPETLRQYTTALNAAQITDHRPANADQRDRGVAHAADQRAQKENPRGQDQRRQSCTSAVMRAGANPTTSSKACWTELNALAGKAAKVDNILAWREAVDAVGKNLTSFSSWMSQYLPKDLEEEGAQIDRVTQDGEKGAARSQVPPGPDQGVDRARSTRQKSNSNLPTTPCDRRWRSWQR